MSELTAAQLEATEYLNCDACVVAGPGSGKTTVLVERYRRLIQERGFDAAQILAITFTEKAAASMKAKVAAKLGHAEDSAWISTIHGFCARLLRENAVAAGIDPHFVVLDARESEELQAVCLDDALDELVAGGRDAAIAFMEALQTPRIAGDLLCVWDAMRAAGLTVEDVRIMPSPYASVTASSVAARMRSNLAAWPPYAQLTPARRNHFDDLSDWVRQGCRGKSPLHLGKVPESSKEELTEFRDTLLPALAAAEIDARTAHFRSVIFDILVRFEALYDRRKAERAALDFDDLERRAIGLLRGSDEVRSRVRSQFRQIMLDEFQDLNERQTELIRLIRADHVFFGVGDINQSIYGFRHARPQIFRDYRNAVVSGGSQSVELMDNFRSRPEILRRVEDLLNSEDGIEPHTLHAAAAFAPQTESPVEILRILEDPDDDEGGAREARWIAHRILELRADFDFRDFAVLCRGHDAMKPILAVFDGIGIPYVCGRRQSFLLSREGLDIRALLSVIANPRDEISLATVLRSGLVGLSDEGLLRLRLGGTSLVSGLNGFSGGAGFDPDDGRKLLRFAACLKRWRADQPVMPLDLLIVRMLSDCGFTPTENVEAFLRLARGPAGRRPLPEFLRELESIESAVGAEYELSDEDRPDAVQVMTAHAAKGLEFPVTIVAAMQKGPQRSGATVSFTPEHGLGLRWKGPSPKDGLKDSWALANGVRLKQREKEEENRLLYVAMTRAQERLILSYTVDDKRKPGGWAKLLEPGVSIVTDPPAPSLSSLDRLYPAEVPPLPRPVAAGQRDGSVTVTALSLFAQCPRRYYLERYLGWNSLRSGGFDPEERGEELDRGDESGTEMGSFVHALLAGKPGEYPASAHQLANVFLESDLGRRSAAAPRLELEWEFIADMEGTMVRGSVDRWFQENGEIHLIDYKTDAKVNPDDHASQLALYALAIERSVGKRPATAYLHYLRSNQVVGIPIDDPALNRALALVGELGEAQNTLTFETKPAGHCYTCPFHRTLCPC